MENGIEARLKKAAAQIVPDGAARERILEGVKANKASRKRLSLRVPAAVLAACMLVCLLWFGSVPALMGEEIVVYAATEGQNWQKLEEGERIPLKKEPWQTHEVYGDIGDWDAYGRCTYYPYKCTFRVDVPENYLYHNSFAMIQDDCITAEGDLIEWYIAPERPEDVGKVMKTTIRLWIVSDKIVKGMRERVAGLDLELTKEDGKCYAELKRVWESSVYEEYTK